jgi:hypothetical protein
MGKENKVKKKNFTELYLVTKEMFKKIHDKVKKDNYITSSKKRNNNLEEKVYIKGGNKKIIGSPSGYGEVLNDPIINVEITPEQDIPPQPAIVEEEFFDFPESQSMQNYEEDDYLMDYDNYRLNFPEQFQRVDQMNPGVSVEIQTESQSDDKSTQTDVKKPFVNLSMQHNVAKTDIPGKPVNLSISRGVGKTDIPGKPVNLTFHHGLSKTDIPGKRLNLSISRGEAKTDIPGKKPVKLTVTHDVSKTDIPNRPQNLVSSIGIARTDIPSRPRNLEISGGIAQTDIPSKPRNLVMSSGISQTNIPPKVKRQHLSTSRTYSTSYTPPTRESREVFVQTDTQPPSITVQAVPSNIPRTQSRIPISNIKISTTDTGAVPKIRTGRMGQYHEPRNVPEPMIVDDDDERQQTEEVRRDSTRVPPNKPKPERRSSTKVPPNNPKPERTRSSTRVPPNKPEPRKTKEEKKENRNRKGDIPKFPHQEKIFKRSKVFISKKDEEDPNVKRLIDDILSSNSKNAYDVLKLSKTPPISLGRLKERFNYLSKKIHPDKTNVKHAHEAFILVRSAYLDILREINYRDKNKPQKGYGIKKWFKL